MGAMNLPDAQLRQANSQRDLFLRIAAILAEAVKTGTSDALIRLNGAIAIRRAAFDAVSSRWNLVVKMGSVKKSEDPNETDTVDVVVVDLAPVEEAPRLVVARAAPSVNGLVTP